MSGLLVRRRASRAIERAARLRERALAVLANPNSTPAERQQAELDLDDAASADEAIDALLTMESR